MLWSYIIPHKEKLFPIRAFFQHCQLKLAILGVTGKRSSLCHVTMWRHRCVTNRHSSESNRRNCAWRSESPREEWKRNTEWCIAFTFHKNNGKRGYFALVFPNRSSQFWEKGDAKRSWDCTYELYYNENMAAITLLTSSHDSFKWLIDWFIKCEGNVFTLWSVGYVKSLASCVVVRSEPNPDGVMPYQEAARSHTATVFGNIAKILLNGQHEIVLGATRWLFNVKLTSKTNPNTESTRYLHSPGTALILGILMGVAWGANCSRWLS